MKTRAIMLGALLCGMCLATAEKPTLESLQEGYEAATKEMMAAYKAAATAEERRAILDKRPTPEETVKAMMPLIEAQADDPEVLEHVTWVVRTTRGSYPAELMQVINKHRESDQLGDLLIMAGYLGDGPLGEWLAWVREESPHEQMRGVAAYAKTMDRGIGQEEKVAELKFAAERVGDFEMRGKRLKDSVDGALYEAEHLQIGKVAGEIEGVDQDGVAFKLSDYRGKVVVLDFWGDW